MHKATGFEEDFRVEREKYPVLKCKEVIFYTGDSKCLEAGHSTTKFWRNMQIAEVFQCVR